MVDPSGSGSGSKKPKAIDDLLQRLGIEDDEIDDLVFEEEESVPKEGVKWMALVIGRKKYCFNIWRTICSPFSVFA
jgi:hypothetical protein